MKPGRHALAAICGLMLLGALPAYAQPGGGLEAELDRLGERYAAAYQAGDADALAALFTADAQVYTTAGDVLVGADVLRGSFQQEFDRRSGEETWTAQPKEVIELGDAVLWIGTTTVTNVSENGETSSAGTFAVLIKRDAGTWKIHRILPVAQGM